jgi:exodeoxyribonuclease VII large subunit
MRPAAQLDSLSPLAVLGRGYSITERLPSGEVVRDASALAPGERIRTRLASGGAISRIEEIEDA